MNHDQSKSVTEIAEGFPPTTPNCNDRAVRVESIVRLNEPSAMEVFFAWEKLRIAFSVFALASLSVTPAFLFFRGDIFTRSRVTVVLLSANLLIGLGPAGENYLCWFGLGRRAARIIVYAILTILLLIWFWIMSMSESV